MKLNDLFTDIFIDNHLEIDHQLQIDHSTKVSDIRKLTMNGNLSTNFPQKYHNYLN